MLITHPRRFRFHGHGKNVSNNTAYYNSNYSIGYGEAGGYYSIPLGTATWTFNGLEQGQYQIAADWVGNHNNTATAPYTFLDGNTSLGTVIANQQITPSDFNAAGVNWAILADALTVSSGTLTIQLSNQHGQVTADAIRIEKLPDSTNDVPSVSVTNSSGTNLTNGSSVSFGSTVAGVAVSKTFTVTNSGFANLTLSSITPVSGVAVQAGFGLSTLTPGETTTFTLVMTAETAVNVNATIAFTTNDPNNPTFQLALTGTVVAAAYQDDTSATFTGQYVWASSSGSPYYNANYRVGHGEGTGYSPLPLGTATWTFNNLEPGLYQVAADFIGSTDNTASAPYMLLDGTQSLGTVNVNQQITPADVIDAGLGWKVLASAAAIQNGSLTVQLSNQNGQVVADAIRLQRVGALPITNAAELEVIGPNGIPLTSGTVFNVGAPFAGEILNSIFTVVNLGTTNLSLSALSIPNGFSLVSPFGSATLTPGESTTFTVRIATDAPAVISGGLSFTTNDPNNGSFNLTLSGSVVSQGYLDDGSADFMGGTWQTRSGAAYVNSSYMLDYGVSGGGPESTPFGTATWSFTNLAPGLYQVAVDYVGGSGNSTSAPYTLRDGADERGIVQVNQQSTPDDFTDAGVAWKTLASGLAVRLDKGLGEASYSAGVCRSV